MASVVKRGSAFTKRQRSSLEDLANVLLPEGHGLPGASGARAIELLEKHVGAWDLTARTGALSLVTAWELSPLASRRPMTFSRMSYEQQEDWVARNQRSRFASRRLLVQALKQLVFLAWACSPEVEEALGYDYRCARDNEPHGTKRVPLKEPHVFVPPRRPRNYARPGPATAAGAIPAERMSVSTFAERGSTRLSTASWPDLDPGEERVQVLVIGSGAGGAVTAATLAEKGLDVLVLEEGPQVTAEDDFNGPMFERFQRFCRDNGTSLIWGRPPIPLPLGKVVGGTTVVNSGTCFRAPDRILERWETEYGVRDARMDSMQPHFREIEEYLNVRPVPWKLLGPNGMAAHRGAVALGYSGGPLLRNITDCHGCGQCAFGCPTDAKQAMHVSYLPRAQRAGARIYARARAERILIEEGRAVGAEVSLLGPDGRRKGRLRVRADHIVLCAGAIHTPVLLEASHVPDPSGQTGRNLRIHPATGIAAEFAEDWVSWKGTLQSYYIDEFFDSHELMFEATTAVPSIGAGSVPGIGAEAMQELAVMDHLATLGFYVSDTSRGRVRRLPKGRVAVTYRMNELDARRMARGLRIAAEVLLAAGAKRAYIGLPGLKEVSSRPELEQVDERVRRDHLKLTAFHPMGTVRMGEDPERSVVDSFGRHHSVANLWVADASVFPSCVAVNPQMTIMAFAGRTASTLASSV
jgi:choline dehydrogenase-like flavoprotein